MTEECLFLDVQPPFMTYRKLCGNDRAGIRYSLRTIPVPNPVDLPWEKKVVIRGKIEDGKVCYHCAYQLSILVL